MSERFTRERVMHELRRRKLTVVRSELMAPGMQRVTLGGAELADFTSPGPADHIKISVPGGGEPAVRDYTPLEFRADGPKGPELDIDFFLHGVGSHGAVSHGGGPAANWAANASPGDEVEIAGPRGSLMPPTDADELLLVADESALPVAARWLQWAGDQTSVTAYFSIEDPSIATYLAEHEVAGRRLSWLTGRDRDGRLAGILRDSHIGEGTFIFLAGEANSLVPMRRYLRRELGLPKAQVSAHGYWKRGVIALDHHAPLDPRDPDD